MSVFTALFSGVSGINTNGEAVSVIGDNIANVNTHGYKSIRAEFEDVIAGTSDAAGLGSRIEGTKTMHAQGGFEATSLVTDMAIDGRGFFAVRDQSSNDTLYTRAGNFALDRNGYLVNPNGQRLQGFNVDQATGNLLTTTDDVLMSFQPIPPRATANITIDANLDANETAPAAFNLATPASTSNFAASITVFDSMGNDHLVTTYFRKDAPGSWQWFAVVQGSELTSGVDEIEASGTLTFDASGRQTGFTQATNDFDFDGAVQNQAIAFNFGTTTGTGTGLDGITQFGQTNSLNDLTQDGYMPGNLTTVEIDEDGTIVGNYTNGRTNTLGQVALALFQNNQGLERRGGNVYSQTLDSGEPLIDSAQSGGRGNILSQTLEQSNVDLASELIKMVVIQRGFQANSRTISVVNELLGSLVTLGS